MGLWKILIPQNTISNINYCPNPSVELSASDYTAIGAASILRRESTGTIQPYKGGWMLEVTGAASTDGVQCPPFTAGGADPHSFFAFSLLSATDVSVTAHIYTGGGAASTDFATITGTGKWQRLSYGVGVQAATDAGLMFTSSGVFYIDALAYQLPSNATEYIELEYIDGDQPGCAWSGETHNSYSVRDAQSRDGGRWYDMADYGLHVIQPGGIGMPPIFLQSQRRATDNGAEYSGQTTNPRILSLAANIEGDSRAGLHAKRKWLIDAIKNSAYRGNQPFWLEYTGGSEPVRIQAVYNDGLQVSQFSGFNEDVILSLVAFDPFFYGEQDGSGILTASSRGTNIRNFLRRNGEFRTTFDYQLGLQGVNNSLLALAFSPDGQLYGGGAFTETAPTTTAALGYMASYSKVDAVWSIVGSGVNNSVYCLLPLPNNQLVLGGAFTADGGAAPLGYVALWDSTAFSSLSGTDFNNVVNALAYNQVNGEIIAGGAFTTGGGVALDYIAKYSSSAWAKVGTSTDFGAQVRALAYDRFGNLYAGGDFTTAGAGGTATGIAMLSSTGGDWVALSTTPSSDGGAAIYAIKEGPDGLIYAAGAFTTIGGVAANYIACYDGERWKPLGSGLGAIAYAIDFDFDGNLYVGHGGLSAGGRAAYYFAMWNGSTWIPTGATMETSGPAISCFSVATDPQFGDVYFGFANVTSATASRAPSTLTNYGTERARPQFHFYRTGGTSGMVRLVNNLTTRQQIVMNYPIQNGERIVVDTEAGRVISSYRGDVTGNAILRGGNFTDFYLLPGENSVTTFAEGDNSPTFEVYATWRNVYLSADGTSST